ncbi:MAG: hypothetical protein HOP00_05295 [Nitrospira sp.]|nr:hypothetical protein [Nitrospira sp.]
MYRFLTTSVRQHIRVAIISTGLFVSGLLPLASMAMDQAIPGKAEPASPSIRMHLASEWRPLPPPPNNPFHESSVVVEIVNSSNSDFTFRTLHAVFSKGGKKVCASYYFRGSPKPSYPPGIMAFYYQGDERLKADKFPPSMEDFRIRAGESFSITIQSANTRLGDDPIPPELSLTLLSAQGNVVASAELSP